MKRTWAISRHFQATPEGDARWDRAYQSILHWALAAQPATSSESVNSFDSTKEAEHASRRLRPSLYPTTSPKSKH
jgi:hypothetical protein